MFSVIEFVNKPIVLVPFVSFENQQVISRVLIRTNAIESILRLDILQMVEKIKHEAWLETQYYTSPLVKLFSNTELALQALKVLNTANSLLSQYSINLSVAHSVRVLHRSLFDCLMRISYLNSKDSTQDVRIFKNYLFSAMLDNFRKECRTLNDLKEFGLVEFGKDELEACTYSVGNLLYNYDAQWFFDEARKFNIAESELNTNPPVLHFVKDETLFKARVEELRSIYYAEGQTVTANNILKVLECSKLLHKDNNFYSKAESEGKPMIGSDWWPASRKLYKAFTKQYDANPLWMIRYYEALFIDNSSYVHPNIGNSEERLSLDWHDNVVIWNHYLLSTALAQILFFSTILTPEKAHECHGISEAMKMILNESRFAD